ncbi:hypothetical protein PRVXH_001142 [Proteinivorax hydrogeniformans]|uniref:Uncharacterized protein n=1 Tax=Proteinivorax hydrogeniformans TaxID=1826727 RepID=A0AAU8HWL2_9FIRM
MTKIFIFERKRLFPLAILICLLVAITLYDTVTNKASYPVDGEMIYAVNVDQGKIPLHRELVVIDNLDTWVKFLNERDLPHPDYSFDDNNQIAVFAVNFDIRSFVENVNEFGEKVYNIVCSDKKDAYQVYVIPQSKDINVNAINWNFYDSKGNKQDDISVKVNPR